MFISLQCNAVGAAAEDCCRAKAAESGHHLFKYAPATIRQREEQQIQQQRRQRQRMTTTLEVARLTIQFICNIKI